MGMTNYVADEKWLEICFSVNVKDVDIAGAIVNMVVPYGIYIEDYSELEQETMEIAHIDLIEESLLQKDRSKAIIHVYISEDENPLESVAFVKERLNSEGISHEVTISDCKIEDWQNNWKKSYHAVPIGNKLFIRPLWEDDFDAGDRKVINIEPGLAFGSGSHPTTKVCLETLEDYITDSDTVLDIGCGSGILSIATLLLGAKSAFGVDIDEIAVDTALANAKENGFEPPRFNAVVGDLSDKASGKYSVIVANIVADAIMQLNTQVGQFLDDDGVYITGGIIDSREDEVLASFYSNGFEVIDRKENKGWLVFVLKKQ